MNISAEEARQPVFLSQGLHGLVSVGFAFFHHGMECNRTEGFGNHPRMTHRIGRVLVAGGSDCGIIDPFESGTGVDTEAARFLPCNTLVLPPAEHVWTIISCGAKAWQPAPEILDRIAVVLFQYIAISVGCVIITLLIQQSLTEREKIMKVVQSYASKECNEFEIVVNDVTIAYYIEHFKHPINANVLEKPMYEIYYDYNEDDNDYTSSIVTDNYNELQDVIDSIYNML